MKTRFKLIGCVTMSTLIVVAVGHQWANPATGQESGLSSEPSQPPATPQVFPLEAAPLIAASLHDAMHSTLQVTHDRYYQEDEGLIIPAAAMQQVFDDIKSQQNITLRWLVVEGEAMNVDHEAQDEFEKAAVKALASGEAFYEKVTGKTYRRAAPITLSNHCLKCHVPNRSSTQDRKAGLIVSVPL